MFHVNTCDQSPKLSGIGQPVFFPLLTRHGERRMMRWRLKLKSAASLIQSVTARNFPVGPIAASELWLNMWRMSGIDG
jgi:hypothetical protein